jgi:enoyl-[acyl-carrier protein] reductase III
LTAVGIQALVDFIAERYSRLDAMVYNSATGVHRPLDSLSTRHLSTVWQLNVGSFFELAIKLKPLMSRGSRIIALSSEGARRAVTRYGAVGSSKAALEALCRQMAAEWAGIGISVNVVAPGLLETESLAAMENADDRVKREIIANPLARLVRLEEVALATHFLCAPASEGIIGQTIVMDGGKSISGL